jgi:hypothetical protein
MPEREMEMLREKKQLLAEIKELQEAVDKGGWTTDELIEHRDALQQVLALETEVDEAWTPEAVFDEHLSTLRSVKELEEQEA